jgi:hypothetical protein
MVFATLAPTSLAFAHCDPIEGTDYFDTINPLVLPQPATGDFNGPLVPGPNVGPNGILDSDEFALLAEAISSHSSPLHEDGCAAFTANLAQATIDLPAGYRETVAAYFTLGDTDSVTAMVAFFAFFAITLDPADYDLSQAAFLGPNGDADGDTLTNKQEYDAIAGVGGPGSAKRTAFLAAALGGDSGEGETEGHEEGEHEHDPCDVTSIPELTAQGTAFYQVLALLALQPYTWESTDVDAGGIIDRFEVALARHAATHNGFYLDEAKCAYGHNLAAAALEANIGLVQVQTGVDVTEAFATLMSISEDLQTILSTIGLTGTYSVAGGHHKHATPLSPEGDLDGDGWTNLQEYNNIITSGGDEQEYIQAAMNPNVNGLGLNPGLPVAGGTGLMLLIGAFGAAGVLRVKGRK